MNRKFGLCEWILPVEGTTAIEIAKKAGYEGLKIGEAGGRTKGFPLSQKSIQEIYKERAEACNIKLVSLNTADLLMSGNLNYDAKTIRGKMARESIDNGLIACKELGLESIVLIAEPTTPEISCNIRSHLEYANQIAQEYGISVVFQSLQSIDTMKKFMNTLDEKIMVCIDTLNNLRFGTGKAVEHIKAFGKERIGHFNVKDSNKELFTPGQCGCTLLGQGDGEYNKCVNMIKEIGYEGWLFSEAYYHLPPVNSDNHDFINYASSDLKKLKETLGV